MDLVKWFILLFHELVDPTCSCFDSHALKLAYL